MDIDEETKFDGLYLNVVQSKRGIEPLLDSMFSFLRRKTDFFDGPSGTCTGSNDDGSSGKGADIAIQKVIEVVQKHANIYKSDKLAAAVKKQQQQQKRAKSSTQQKVDAALPSSTQSTNSNEEGIIELGNDGKFDISTTSSTSSPHKKNTDTMDGITTNHSTETATNIQTNMANESKNNNDENNDDKRGPPPIGNGGSVDGKYTWTQILSEVVVTVPVPQNTKGKDLNVIIAKNHLKVALRSAKSTEPPIIDAPLTKSIIVDDSFWTVEDNCRLVLTLQKLNTMEWWDSVCVGHTKINVRDIQPENSSLSDLDGDTRQTVEKMMFDQRQKAMGLPTSEEQQKLDILEKFKLQHPELDFSNAKIS